MPRSDYANGTGTALYAERVEFNAFGHAVAEWTPVEATGEAQQAVRLVRASTKPGISPELYFSYVKSKFGILERRKIDARLKKLEAAFNKVVEDGQEALGEKMLLEMVRETKESLMLAKGIKYVIDKADLDKHKRNIRGGHISDTRFKDFTRIIPERVLKRKKEVEDVFDGFIIYHVWDEEAEKKRTKNQKMSDTEKARMRDPILFGYINECNNLYFVADWEDDHCDLTFDQIVEYIGKKEIKDPKILL